MAVSPSSVFLLSLAVGRGSFVRFVARFHTSRGSGHAPSCGDPSRRCPGNPAATRLSAASRQKLVREACPHLDNCQTPGKTNLCHHPASCPTRRPNPLVHKCDICALKKGRFRRCSRKPQYVTCPTCMSHSALFGDFQSCGRFHSAFRSGEFIFARTWARCPKYSARSYEDSMDYKSKGQYRPAGQAVWCPECCLRIAPYDLRTVFRGKDYHRNCFQKMTRRKESVQPAHLPGKG